MKEILENYAILIAIFRHSAIVSIVNIIFRDAIDRGLFLEIMSLETVTCHSP